MAVVTMRELLDAGVHFGHQTRRWNPKMRRFIFTDRNGIYIIDLQQTLTYIDEAYEFVKETVAHGGSVLFVGTKKQAQEPVQEEAERVGMPYVNHRWLGGMLTNFQTVSKRLARMKELQAMDAAEDGYAGRGKKEVLMLTRERTKLERVLGGISDMTKTPSALWIVDTNKEHIAVSEAKKLRIPVVAILDTNCDPDEVDYPIPGNDDAIRSVKLLTRIVGEAVVAGKQAREERQLNQARNAAGDGQAAGSVDQTGAAEAQTGQDEAISEVESAATAGADSQEVVETVENVEANETVEAKGTPETPAAAEADNANEAQDGAAADAIEKIDNPETDVDPV